MKFPSSRRGLIAAALLASTGLGVAGVAGATVLHTPAPVVHGLFVETDQASGNRILSYSRSTDGSIALAGSYPTGGLGGTEVGATADPLASQDGLLLLDGGKALLSTNAGSNTISVFYVTGTKLLLAQRISSDGAFPVSLSQHGSWISVLNAGGEGSVAEFIWNGAHLLTTPGEVRTLNLGNTNPPNYLMGPGEVQYSPNGKYLIVADKHSNDSFSVFTVSSRGVLGASPLVTASQNPVPFAFLFSSNGNIIDTEAGNSSVNTYGINLDGSLAPIGTASDGATALCWISEARGYYFGSNAGSATISTFTVSPTGVVTLDNATAASTHPGTTDSVTSPDGHFLYVESGGSGALDVFGVSATGVLSPVETLWNIPVGSEGIAIS